MSDDEKTEATEQDAEKSEWDEKKTRRSSILKHQKPRNPLSTLELTEPNPDTTIAKAARRVSFASSNLVKPFAADPEKNTIWDTTYEEEVNHTDSTKSSNEQTKFNDLLNATSINFSEYEELMEDFKPSPPNTWEETLAKLIDKENIVPKLNVKAKEMELLVVNKENIYMEKIVKQISPILTGNLELRNNTLCDATLIHPAEKIIHSENLKARCNNVGSFGEQSIINQCDMELTDCLSVDIRENNINKTVYCENDMDFTTGLDVKPRMIYPDKSEGDMNFTATKCTEIGMEFTCALSNTIIADIRNGNKADTSTTASQRQDFEKKSGCRGETVYFNASKDDMEFTSALPVNMLQNNMWNNKTMNFDDGKNDMELTTVKSGIIKENYQSEGASRATSHTTAPSIKNRVEAETTDTSAYTLPKQGDKRKTIYFNSNNGDMEFTAALPLNTLQNNVQDNKTIHFNEDKNEMELTIDKSCRIKENHANREQKNVEYIPPIGNMKNIRHGIETSTLPKQDYRRKTIYFDTTNGDMEFTTALPVNLPQNNVQDSKTINFNEEKNDMELTTPIKSGIIKENYTNRERNLEYIPATGNTKNISRHGIEMVDTSASALPKHDHKRKTIYFDVQDGDLEFTTALPINFPQNNVQNNKTINFNEEKNDMELTAISSGIVKESYAQRDQRNPEFNESGDNMELTSVTTTGNIKEFSKDQVETFGKTFSTLPNQDYKRKTIYFKLTDGDMDITTASPPDAVVTKARLTPQNKTINFSEDECPMELTTVKSAVKEKGAGRETIEVNKSNDDMELSSALPDRITRARCKLRATNKTALEERMDVTGHLDDKSGTLKASGSAVKENGAGRGTVEFNRSNDDTELPSALPDKRMLTRARSKLRATNKAALEERVDVTGYLEDKSGTLKASVSQETESKRDDAEKSLSPLKENELPNTDNLSPDFATTTSSKGVSNGNVHKVNPTEFTLTKEMNAGNDAPVENANVSVNKNIGNNLNEDQIVGGSSVETTAPALHNKPAEQNLDLSKTKNQKVNRNVSRTKLTEPPPETSLDPVLNSQTSKDSIIGIKRQSNSNDDDIVLKKRNCVDPHEPQTELPSPNESIEHYHPDAQTNDGKVKDPKLGLQTSTLSNSNILYSEPMRIKFKPHNFTNIPDLSDNLNIRSLNSSVKSKLGSVSTPATSFHMTLTDSPCIEDTQQLIYATFSKPEHSKNVEDGPPHAEVKNINGENVLPAPLEDSKMNISYLEDETVDLAPYEFDDPKEDPEDIILPLKGVNAEKCIDSPADISQSYDHDYTLRSEVVLQGIEKFTEHYEIVRHVPTNLIAAAKESKRNCDLIRDLIEKIRRSRIQLVDLEEKHKQDNSSNENLSNMSESTTNSEDDRGAPSMAGLMAPKSLYERVCEAYERSKKRWKLLKVEDDYYYFFTLFGCLPFKVHVHPDLGIVMGVKTYTNLREDSRPVCWYDLKVFQRKLENDNLLSVLGSKFDILTLLDYVYMTMEEVTNFHLEYISLVKKYGVSHHFRMNRDLSVTFEIIDLELIIHWIISVNILPNVSISKETVKAASEVGEKVQEDDIIHVAENTPKGPKFLSNFIENVDEYVKRIEKKIKFRRGNR